MGKRTAVLPDSVQVSAKTDFLCYADDGADINTADGKNVQTGKCLTAAKTFQRWNPENCNMYGVYAFRDGIAYSCEYGVTSLVNNVAKNVFDLVADSADTLFVCDPDSRKSYLYYNKKAYVFDGENAKRMQGADGKKVAALAVCGGRVFCAVGSSVLYSAVDGTELGEDNGGGTLNFVEDVTALCALDNKLYVFADRAYVVDLSYDEEYFALKPFSAVHAVSYAVAARGKVYCFSDKGLVLAEKPDKPIALPVETGTAPACPPCVIGDKIYFCTAQKTFGYDAADGSVVILDGGFTTLATDGTNLYGCNGTQAYVATATPSEITWTSKPVTFGVYGKKYLRKIYVVAQGDVTVTLDGKRKFTLQLENADGRVAQAPCYLDGDEFTLGVSLAPSATVKSIRLDGIVYQKEVYVCKNR